MGDGPGPQRPEELLADAAADPHAGLDVSALVTRARRRRLARRTVAALSVVVVAASAATAREIGMAGGRG